MRFTHHILRNEEPGGGPQVLARTLVIVACFALTVPARADSSVPYTSHPPKGAGVTMPSDTAREAKPVLRRIATGRAAMARFIDPRRGLLSISFEDYADDGDADRACGAKLWERVHTLQNEVTRLAREEDWRFVGCRTRGGDYVSLDAGGMVGSRRITAECQYSGDHDHSDLHLLFTSDRERIYVLVAVLYLQEAGMSARWISRVRGYARRQLKRLLDGACAAQ